MTIALLLSLPARPAGAQIFERTDAQKEIELGRAAAREVEKEIGLSRDRAMQERVQRIGQELVENLPVKAYPYQFKVLASPEVNAFSLPGGFIYFYEGLIGRLPSDDAVAFVMGHEITHASNRHWHKIMERMKGITIAAVLASVATRGGDAIGFAHMLITLQYSRENEDEADRVGLELMWRAGFNTQGGLDAMKLLADLEKGHTPPALLSSHPNPGDRLKKMTKQAAILRDTPRPRRNLPSADLDVSALVGTLPVAAVAPDPWFPLATGNNWSWSVATPDGTRSSYTLRVVGSVPVSGGEVFRAETSLGSSGTKVACQLLSTPEGVWRRSRLTAPNSRWEIEHVTQLPDTGGVEREGRTFTSAGREAIAVPCGSFPDALKVRLKSPSGTFDLWYAKGVGLLKRVCVETGVTETLVAYKVQPVPAANNTAGR